MSRWIKKYFPIALIIFASCQRHRHKTSDDAVPVSHKSTTSRPIADNGPEGETYVRYDSEDGEAVVIAPKAVVHLEIQTTDRPSDKTIVLGEKKEAKFYQVSDIQVSGPLNNNNGMTLLSIPPELPLTVCLREYGDGYPVRLLFGSAVEEVPHGSLSDYSDDDGVRYVCAGILISVKQTFAFGYVSQTASLDIDAPWFTLNDDGTVTFKRKAGSTVDYFTIGKGEQCLRDAQTFPADTEQAVTVPKDGAICAVRCFSAGFCVTSRAIRFSPEGHIVASDDFVVTSGRNHACWLTSGSLSCRGNNDFGQLGPISALSVKSVYASSDQSCLIGTDGVPKCFGLNLDSAKPQLQKDPTKVVKFDKIVTGGSYKCALKVVGSIINEVFCWGQPGDGDSAKPNSGDPSNTPSKNIQRLDGGQAWVDLNLGLNYACGVSADGLTLTSQNQTGKIYCWGNIDGNRIENPSLSVPVQDRSDFVKVGVGIDHTCGLTKSGSLFCWGGNTHGQRCISGGNVNEANIIAADVISFVAGGYLTLVIKKTGELLGCGHLPPAFEAVDSINPSVINGVPFLTPLRDSNYQWLKIFVSFQNEILFGELVGDQKRCFGQNPDGVTLCGSGGYVSSPIGL